MTTTPVPVRSNALDVADDAAPLDSLLVDAALGSVRRLLPDSSTARFAARLIRRPRTTGGRLGHLVGELARVGAGTSTVAPSRRDRRFTDPAWTDNPLLRRLVQAYLAGADTLQQLVADADLDWRDDRRVRFLTENLMEAAAPSNVPLVNPASAKAVIDTAGLNMARGAANFVRDMAAPPRVPAMVDTSGFEVGGNIAATPGAVVLRTELFELLDAAVLPAAGPADRGGQADGHDRRAGQDAQHPHGSTCWARPSAASSPSSWRTRRRIWCGGWSSPPPAPVRPCSEACLGRRARLSTWRRRAATGRSTTTGRWPEPSTEAPPGRTPTRCCTVDRPVHRGTHAARLRRPALRDQLLDRAAVAAATPAAHPRPRRRRRPHRPPVNGRILSRLIPHARLEVVPGGHLFLLERPEEMAALIADFTAC